MNKQIHKSRPPASCSDQIALASPVMTKERFAEVSGLREGQIRGQMERGNLPVYYVGRLAMVNLVKLAWRELPLSVPPVMTKDHFALASGLRDRQVESQLDRGHLPFHYVGRLLLVDVAELTKRCLEIQENESTYQ